MYWFQWKGEKSTLAKYSLYFPTHPSILSKIHRNLILPEPQKKAGMYNSVALNSLLRESMI